jgi:hypothetical protein
MKINGRSVLLTHDVVLPKKRRDDVSEATPAPRASAVRTSTIISETLRFAQGITFHYKFRKNTRSDI